MLGSCARTGGEPKVCTRTSSAGCFSSSRALAATSIASAPPSECPAPLKQVVQVLGLIPSTSSIDYCAYWVVREGCSIVSGCADYGME